MTDSEIDDAILAMALPCLMITMKFPPSSLYFFSDTRVSRSSECRKH